MSSSFMSNRGTQASPFSRRTALVAATCAALFGPGWSQGVPHSADGRGLQVCWRVTRVLSESAARERAAEPYVRTIDGLRTALQGNLGDVPEPLRAKTRTDFEDRLTRFEGTLEALDLHPELIPILANFDGVTTATIDLERNRLHVVSRSLTEDGPLEAAVSADPRLKLIRTNYHPHERFAIEGGVASEDKYWGDEIRKTVVDGDVLNRRIRDVASFAGRMHPSWMSLGRAERSANPGGDRILIKVDAGGEDADWSLRTMPGGEELASARLEYDGKEMESITTEDWRNVSGLRLPGRVVRVVREPSTGEVMLTETRVLLSAGPVPDGFEWQLAESVGPGGP